MFTLYTQIFDYKMMDERLLEILHENLRASEKRRIEIDLQKQREEGLLSMVQNYSADVIQRQAKIFLARRKRQRGYWRIALAMKASRELQEQDARQVGKSDGNQTVLPQARSYGRIFIHTYRSYNVHSYAS